MTESTRHSRSPFPKKTPAVSLRVAATYAIFAGLWISFSDLILMKWVDEATALGEWSLLKGWFFVIITSVLLHGLLRLHEGQLAREAAQRDASERALNEADAQIRWLGDHLPGCYMFQYIRGGDGAPRFLYIGAEAERIHLLSPLEIMRDGHLLAEQLLPDQREAFWKVAQLSYEQLLDLDHELQIVRRDGQKRWLRVRACPRRRPDGKVILDGIVMDVSNDKLAQEALRASEERWRALVTLSPDALFIDQDDRVVFVSQSGLALWRATSDAQILGRTPWELFDPAYHDAVRARIAELRRNGGMLKPWETQLVALDGTLIPVETAAAMVPYGDRPAIQVVVRDISDRKRAEQKLRMHEAILEETGRIAKVGGWNYDVASDTATWTDEVARIHEIEPRPTVSREMGVQFYVPESRARLDSAIQSALELGLSYDLELELITAKGNRKWVRTIGHPVFKDGSVVSIHGSFQDVSERRRLDAERERQRRRMTLLADISRRLVVSDTPAQILQGIFSDIAHELDIDIFANYMVTSSGDRLVLENSGGLTLEQHVAFADLAFGQSLCGLVAQGRKRMVFADLPSSSEPQAAGVIALGVKAYAGLPLVAGERLIGTVSFGSRRRDRYSDEDIRLMKAVADQVVAALDRDRLMAALRESEERFREVVENILEVFWMTDVGKDRVVYISPGFELIWGRSCASLHQSLNVWRDSIHPDDRDRVLAAAMTEQEKGTYHESYRIIRPDGTLRWVRDRAFPVKNAAGRVIRIVGVAEDITAQRDLESRLLRSQRLEAVGTLAGGIAHDLNNILAPVLMISGLLKDRLVAQADQKMLAMLETAAKRGAGIIRQLLAFSRGAGGEKGIVQVRHLAKEMCSLMKETFPRDITITDNFPADLWPVLGDGTQLHQVLMNLCVNARDAMPDGGKLQLRGVNRELSRAEVASQADCEPGRYVCLTVQDSGHGIPADIVGRIFDPFFTTKELGKGTGLGLSTVMGIIRSHRGFITLETVEGQGTSFHVHLPAAEAAALREFTDSNAPSIRGRGELLLVVDDETSIATATRRFLEEHNYRVLTAPNGREALARFLENQDSIRLVLTDLMMPVMGGVALARALKGLKPDLPIVATTGLQQQEKQEELRQIGVTEILAKPCLPAEMLAEIRRHIDGA